MQSPCKLALFENWQRRRRRTCFVLSSQEKVKERGAAVQYRIVPLGRRARNDLWFSVSNVYSLWHCRLFSVCLLKKLVKSEGSLTHTNRPSAVATSRRRGEFEWILLQTMQKLSASVRTASPTWKFILMHFWHTTVCFFQSAHFSLPTLYGGTCTSYSLGVFSERSR